MKRWLVAFLLGAVPIIGVFLPAGAQASPATDGQLTSGQPTVVTIASVGQEPQYTFAAQASGHVTFQVTQFDVTNGSSGGSVYLYFYEPGSSSYFTYCGFSGNSYCDFTAPQSGTWSVVVDPSSSSVGSFSLTFANDVATKALTSGTAVSTTIKFQGQNAGYTFAAKAGRHVTFQLSKFHFTDNGSGGSAYLYFYEPGSSSYYTYCGFSSNGYCDLTTPESGTWSVGLDPSSASVGSLTLTFANDVATRALTPGKAVTTTIKFQGQNAGYTFTAKAHKRAKFQISKFHFTDAGSGGSAYLYFYEPGSSSDYTYCGFSSNSSCIFTTPVGGKWKVTLDPSSASVGSLALKLTWP